MVTIEKQIRQDTPQVSVAPYKQIHAHSTGNPSSTAQNEADYMNRKDLSSGFFTHVVGNGRIIQTARTNRGAWDVGGSWNNKTYAAVELIESHKTQAEFDRDYKIYVDLLRSLANEGGITLKVDAGSKGINTHYYCTYNQPSNKSDHIDPYPYLQKWGVSKAQFKKDVESGSVTPSKPSPSVPAPSQPTYAVKAWNKRQIVDIDVLNVRTTATSKSGLVRQLKKGQTFNATRIITNGELVGKYRSWFEADGWGWVSGAYVTEIKQPTVPSTPQIAVDGYWGTDTTKRLQQIFGTYQDGVISKPSNMVKAMQKRLGVTADGYLGKVTITALQRHYGTTVDGVISKQSNVVKAMQRTLNQNKF